MRHLLAGLIMASTISSVPHVPSAEGATIAVFTKNTTNPAYQAFRLAADQVGKAAGAKIVHFVPKQPDNVDEQIAMVEQVLKDRPDAVVFIPVDDVALVESGEEAQRGEDPDRAGGEPAARQFRHLRRRR